MNDTTQKQEYDEQRGKEEKKKGVNTLDRLLHQKGRGKQSVKKDTRKN